MFDDDDILPVPLDPPLRAWLTEIARGSGAPLAVLVKSMLEAIREDDEAMHNYH